MARKIKDKDAWEKRKKFVTELVVKHPEMKVAEINEKVKGEFRSAMNIQTLYNLRKSVLAGLAAEGKLPGDFKLPKSLRGTAPKAAPTTAAAPTTPAPADAPLTSAGRNPEESKVTAVEGRVFIYRTRDVSEGESIRQFVEQMRAAGETRLAVAHVHSEQVILTSGAGAA